MLLEILFIIFYIGDLREDENRTPCRKRNTVLSKLIVDSVKENIFVCQEPVNYSGGQNGKSALAEIINSQSLKIGNSQKQTSKVIDSSIEQYKISNNVDASPVQNQSTTKSNSKISCYGYF